MAPVDMSIFVLYTLATFLVGATVGMRWAIWYRQHLERKFSQREPGTKASDDKMGVLTKFRRARSQAKKSRQDGIPRKVSRSDIRNEFHRDPVAAELFLSDDTPDDVQRYLYLEAGRRALLRRRRQLDNDENDFFAPPKRHGPDPGFSGCRN